MYRPEFQISQFGIPIVSGEELDTLGERLVTDFSSGMAFTPSEIDIDRFIVGYLGMKQDYCYLSHCGVYLGMTVFRDSSCIPVYFPEQKKADYISAKAGTVILDPSLLEEGQEHRYRFTMGHEGSHKIMHTAYFLDDIGQRNPYVKANDAFVRCRADHYQFNISSNEFRWTNAKRVEWQANRLSSAILMPKSMVRMLMARMPNRGEAAWPRMVSKQVSEVFNVSLEAAFYRLKDLGFLDKDICFAKKTLSS